MLLCLQGTEYSTCLRQSLCTMSKIRLTVLFAFFIVISICPDSVNIVLDLTVCINIFEMIECR